MLFETMPKTSLSAHILYDFQTEISRFRSKSRKILADREIQIYIAGMEVANGFSELNDPAEQERRFLEQMAQVAPKSQSSSTWTTFALSATACPHGRGRHRHRRLTNVLTDSPSHPRVILFPQLRPEGGGELSSEGHGA